MLNRRLRLLMFVGILLLPSCIVVTCGETRTFPVGRESQAAPQDTFRPGQPDTSSGSW